MSLGQLDHVERQGENHCGRPGLHLDVMHLIFDL